MLQLCNTNIEILQAITVQAEPPPIPPSIQKLLNTFEDIF